MTDDSAISPPHELLSTFERILGKFLRIPFRYFLLATICSLLLFVARITTPPGPWNPYSYGLPHYVSAVGWMGGLLLTAAPLVALRWVPMATFLAVLPLSTAALVGHQWPFTTFCGLVAVAAVGTWRSVRQSLVAAVLAVGTIVLLVTTPTTMLVPDGAQIQVGAPADWDSTQRIQLPAIYAVVVALSFAAAMWLRSAARAAKHEADLARRSAVVDGEAAAVGERARLARDLHDVVAHHVSLIAVRAETAPYTHPGLEPEARGVLADIAADARGALEELRGVLGVL
ncbi:MAG: sensor histidine kinase, partial [Nocardioidaceae bacterium]